MEEGEDEDIQTKHTIIMIDTDNNQPQLISIKDEESAAKPELNNSLQKHHDDIDSGVAETNHRASISVETLESSCDLPCSFEVPVEYALHPFELAEKTQGKLGACKLGSNKGRVGQTAAAQANNQQGRPDYPLSSELSPASVTRSVSSIPSPCVTGERVDQGSNRTRTCMPALDRGKSSSSKPLSIVPSHRIPSHDGYNWRKYGQKQVKSPQGSRSYYRCTYSDCYAKKIECSDHTNRVMEIVYRSHHNHDPPQKLSCMRGSKLALVLPVNESSTHEARPTDDSLPSISSNDLVPENVPAIDSIEPPVPSTSDENTETEVTQEHVNETELQKKLKRSSSSNTDSLPKPGKRSKVIVHASGEVYISGDGYRWRKYGQKMVKGNPHPRNYYRCTSAGCPVRKHIERAKDNTTDFVITYKGKHDHDMPVPKIRDGITAPLVACASPCTHTPPTVMKSESFQERVSAARPELGEKTAESAKTPFEYWI